MIAGTGRIPKTDHGCAAQRRCRRPHVRIRSTPGRTILGPSGAAAGSVGGGPVVPYRIERHPDRRGDRLRCWRIGRRERGHWCEGSRRGDRPHGPHLPTALATGRTTTVRSQSPGYKRTIFVSRRSGARQWVEERDLAVDVATRHLDVDDIHSGGTIVGTLPIDPAATACAVGARCLHLAIGLPVWRRGTEPESDGLCVRGTGSIEHRAILTGP